MITRSELVCMIPEFSGVEAADVESWFELIGPIDEIYKIADNRLAVVIRKKLKGPARKRFHYRVEYV